MTNSIEEISKADYILAIGTNTTESHPIIGLEVKKAIRNGTGLAVADPRKTEVASMAHRHMQLKSGSDIALLNGLAHVIIEEGLYAKEFVEERTEDFEAFKETVSKYTPECVEEITGVPVDILKEVARNYAQAKNAPILYTMGITQHICGTHNVLAVANLSMLCGHIGKESSGVNPLRGQNNVQGACDMGALPNVFTAYQKVGMENVQAKYANAWNVDALPDKVGINIGQMMERAGSNVKAMYIMGENPVLSDPDSNHVAHALESLDFLVVQDIFLTETARLADVVLPATSFAEKDGTFTNTERRVQRVRKAIDPVGNAMPDWEIICNLSSVMGYPMNYSSAKDIFDEISTVTPSYAGMSYERLDNGGLQWPCPTEDHPGTPYLHKDKFARGLGKFSAVDYVPPAEQPDAEYPMILSTGRRHFHYHTGTMTRRTGTLDKYYNEESLEINEIDAQKLGINNGDKVKVTSRRGSVEVKACVGDTVPEGMVFTSFHFSEVAINKVTNSQVDPVSNIPEFKVCAVRVEKYSAKNVS